MYKVKDNGDKKDIPATWQTVEDLMFRAIELAVDLGVDQAEFKIIISADDIKDYPGKQVFWRKDQETPVLDIPVENSPLIDTGEVGILLTTKLGEDN